MFVPYTVHRHPDQSVQPRHTALSDPVLGARRSSDVGCRGHRICEVNRGPVNPIGICSIGCNNNAQNCQESDTTPGSPSLPSDGQQLDECRRPQDGGQGPSMLHWSGCGVGAPAYTSRGPDTVPMVGAGLHHTTSRTHQAPEQFERLRLAVPGLGGIAQCRVNHGHDGHRQLHHHIHQLHCHSDLRFHYHHPPGELHCKYHRHHGRAADRQGSLAADVGVCPDPDPCGHDARVRLLDGW